MEYQVDDGEGWGGGGVECIRREGLLWSSEWMRWDGVGLKSRRSLL